MIPPSSARWDKLLVAGMTSPGVVRITGNDLKIGWDIQEATLTTVAITRRKGEPLKEFDADFYLTDEVNFAGRSDFDDWDPFQRKLQTAVANRLKPVALDVYHPDLARNGITAATIGSIGGLQLDGKGGGTIKVHFLEYRPPKPIRGVTLTKTPGDAKIESAMAEINKLQTEWSKM